MIGNNIKKFRKKKVDIEEICLIVDIHICCAKFLLLKI